MQTENKRFADFSPLPQDVQANIIVKRILPDGSKEPIGWICQDFSDFNNAPTYLCLDEYGEELFPPTVDYAEAESRFERFAKRLSQNERTKTVNGIRQRKEEITNVREKKGRNEKQIAITK
jgi:hypothetical protein